VLTGLTCAIALLLTRLAATRRAAGLYRRP
jgi:hypothetical protein